MSHPIAWLVNKNRMIFCSIEGMSLPCVTSSVSRVLLGILFAVLTLGMMLPAQAGVTLDYPGFWTGDTTLPGTPSKFLCGA